MFMETYNWNVFAQCGLPVKWSQDNLSETAEGVIRGMHFQNVNPQGKLIHCIYGQIQDVCIDLRPGPKFGKQYSVVLSSDSQNRELFYVPPGFAHGFLAISDSMVHYKCTTMYHQQSEGGINPMKSGIPWLVQPGQKILISAKDQESPSWVDYASAHG